MAFSIGSYASVSQPSPIVSISVCSSPDATHVLCTVIWFIVIVPVLSTQRTETAPSVSTLGSLRTSECFFANRHAPIERKTVRITGNSSGIIAMESVTPDRMLSIRRSEKLWSGMLSHVNTPTRTNRTPAMMAQVFTSFPVCF